MPVGISINQVADDTTGALDLKCTDCIDTSTTFKQDTPAYVRPIDGKYLMEPSTNYMAGATLSFTIDEWQNPILYEKFRIKV